MNKYTKYILPFVLLYFYNSIVEWFIHKYIMHNEAFPSGKAHLTHHKSINTKTMEIDETIPHYEMILPYHNLLLNGDLFETILLFIITVLIGPLITIKLLSSSYKLDFYVLAFFQLFMYLFTFYIWNSIHTYMHGKDVDDLCNKCGMSYKTTEYFVKNTSYFKWMIANHTKHHIIKGKKKGNFNIVLPGADFIFNTYN